MSNGNKGKSLGLVVVLTVASILVGAALVVELTTSRTIAKSTAQIEVDRCELMLRINDSLIATGNLLIGPQAMESSGQSSKELARQALPLLLSAQKQNSKDPVVLAKALIVSKYLGDPGEEMLANLASLGGEKANQLSSTLDGIYGKEAINQQKSRELADEIERLLPPSWYRDQARLAAFSKGHEQQLFSQLEERLTMRSFGLTLKLLFIGIFGTIAFIAGLAVLAVQILFTPKPLTPAAELDEIRAPADYGFLRVYAVFIAWLATQLISGVIGQPIVKGLSVSQLGVTGMALLMTIVYIVSNGPGLLYIDLFALKPNQLKFFDALKIRFRSGARGPGRLIGAGVMAWLAAIPVMALAYFISTQLFGSQGSSNPIIAIVTEAARHENFSATLLFYITLGVLAPICEESLFRGFLYTYLRRSWGVLPSALLSAGLFSLAHLDPGGFLPLFSLGMIFAIAIEKTKSLVPAMIAHGLWNSCTFTLVIFLFGN